MTIWQRLNTALLLLILLLLSGVGLALWVEKTRSAVDARGAELLAAKDRLELDLTTMSDAVRGFLLQARNEPERKRRRDAQADLASLTEKLEDRKSVV